MPFRKEDKPPTQPSTSTVPPSNIDLRPAPGTPQEQPPKGAGTYEALEDGRSSGRTVDGAEGAPPGEVGGPLAVSDGYRIPSSTYLQLPDGRMIRDPGNGTFEIVRAEDYVAQDRLNQEISAATMKEIDGIDRSIKSIYTKR